MKKERLHGMLRYAGVLVCVLFCCTLGSRLDVSAAENPQASKKEARNNKNVWDYSYLNTVYGMEIKAESSGYSLKDYDSFNIGDLVKKKGKVSFRELEGGNILSSENFYDLGTILMPDYMKDYINTEFRRFNSILESLFYHKVEEYFFLEHLDEFLNFNGIPYTIKDYPSGTEGWWGSYSLIFDFRNTDYYKDFKECGEVNTLWFVYEGNSIWIDKKIYKFEERIFIPFRLNIVLYDEAYSFFFPENIPLGKNEKGRVLTDYLYNVPDCDFVSTFSDQTRNEVKTTYKVDDLSIVRITKDGVLTPKKTGQTNVLVEFTIEGKPKTYKRVTINVVEENEPIEAFDTYIDENGKTHLRAYHGSDRIVTIPDEIQIIDEKAFYQNYMIQEISFPKQLELIGDAAFQQCCCLKSITVPDSCTSIGKYAFSGCSNLESIDLGNGLTRIDEYTFEKCAQLKEIKIPDGINEIADKAFSNCIRLSKVIFPDSVNTFGAFVFKDCQGIIEITLPKNITEISRCMFYNCTNLKKIVIPDQVTKINAAAFFLCDRLSEVILSTNLKIIEDGAFEFCGSLTQIVIPQKVQSIGEDAFHQTGLKSITLPPKLKKISKNVFAFTYLEMIDIPNSVQSIGENAWSYIKLQQIIVHSKKSEQMVKDYIKNSGYEEDIKIIRKK